MQKKKHRGSCNKDTSNRAKTPPDKGFSYSQTFVSVFLVIGAIVVSAIVFDYSGDLQLKIGADGIQIQVDGRSSLPN
ncbi:MAG TPA: hypothetical protein V6C65_36400 [Allocoleopsis sp.]